MCIAFVRRARDLGFSLDRVGALVKLWGDRSRSSSDVKALALEHIVELEVQVDKMKHMIGTLRHLANACGGNDRPDCPIIDDLTSCGYAAGKRSGKPRARRNGAGAGTRHGAR